MAFGFTVSGRQHGENRGDASACFLTIAFMFTNIFEFLFMLYTLRPGIIIVAVDVICRRLAIAALLARQQRDEAAERNTARRCA